MRNGSRVWPVVGCLVGVAAGGCGPGEGGEGANGEVVRTIVRRLSTGEATSTTEVVTRQAFDREVAARQAIIDGTASQDGVSRSALTTQDTGCGPASLWLFDNPGNTPGPWPYNHEICFVDSDPSNDTMSAARFDLDLYDRMCLEWWTFNPPQRHRECSKWATGGLASTAQSQVRSLWAGKGSGQFAIAGPIVASHVLWDLSFRPYERIDSIRSDYAATIGFLGHE